MEHDILNLVRYLGFHLGKVIREQAGEPMLELEERIRLAARAVRKQYSPEKYEDLVALTSGLEVSTAVTMLRAFTVYFQLANLAEQYDSVERTRAGWSNETNEGRMARALQVLAEHGIDAGTAEKLLTTISITPVLTAHPTEAKRRTVLDLLDRLYHLITEIPLSEQKLEQLDTHSDELLYELTTLWQTDEVRATKLFVQDEVQNGVFYVESVLFDKIAAVNRHLHDVFEQVFSRELVGPITPVRLGSWIGGDRDGNPFVTPQVTETTADYHYAKILTRYDREILKLHRRLSQSINRIGCTPELLASTEEDLASFPALRQNLGERYRAEPYRRKLFIVRARIHATLHDRHSALAYAGVAIFRRDIEIIAESLSRNSGQRVRQELLDPLLSAVDAFGFHLVTLDIREHSDQHQQVVDELLDQTGVCIHYRDHTEEARVKILTNEIVNRRPIVGSELALSEGSAKTFEVFRSIKRVQTHCGARAIENYIISMCEAPTDVLEVLLLAKEAGLARLSSAEAPSSTINIVPLFETIDDLRNAPQVMQQLLANDAYRRNLRARGNLQEIMIGYSDSSKDGSYFASHWELYRAQQNLSALIQSHGIQLRIFHGRGGTTARGGGGPLWRAILAQPRGTISGSIRVTEQGEMIATNYAHPVIAARNLEEMLYATILQSGAPHTALDREEWHNAMQQLAERSYSSYRAFLDQPGFFEFFTAITPFRELSQLNIGSRPAKRGAAQGIGDIRAVPWVFSWTQNRSLFPTWYGVGSALSSFAAGSKSAQELLCSMYREWPFFQNIISNCEMTLAKADMKIVERYGSLIVDPQHRSTFLFQLLREFTLTVEAVLKITEQSSLLERNPTLKRYLSIRERYLDPLSYIQVDLLKRYRSCAAESEKSALLSAIHLSISGVAGGMKNTG